MVVRIVAFLLLLCLLPIAAMATSMEDIILRFDCITTGEVTLCKREVVSTDGEEPVYEYIPIGTLPAGTYVGFLSGADYVNKVDRIRYYSGGYKEAWTKDGMKIRDATCTPVYFIHSESTIFVHYYIASDPDRLAAYMAWMAPGRAYTTIPPWQWDENPPEALVATPTPAPESPTAQPTGGASSATQKPASTTKPASTKKPSSTTKAVKATATPAPTAVPAPEGWLDATWIAENLDPTCTERQEISVVTLGVSESVVILDGEEITVPTDALIFADGVDSKYRIAAIYAPRLGRCILRTKASESSKEIAKCPAGRIVPVLEYGKTWTKIRYEGQIGYVKTAVLTFLGDKEAPIGTGVTSYNGKATGNAQVPVRNGKTSDAEIILNLRTATVVKVLSFDGKWYELEHDGWYGFLYKSYFTYEQE